MPIYKKLIRDRIPEIMSRGGKTYYIRTLSEEEYKMELRKKLSEELEEYFQAAKSTDDNSAVEELADLLELIHTLTTVHHSSPEELERVRARKAEERGGFQERIFLIEVHDA